MKLWQDFLKKLEIDLGKETFEKWLKPIKILKFDATNLHLNATSSFQILWYQEHVTEELKNANGQKIHLHFYLNGEPINRKSKKKSNQDITRQYFSADHLASHAIFTNFIKSESPFLPYDLLKQANSIYNPIFLYGPPGSGKTHLLMATAHQLKEKRKKVFYVRAGTFTEHVIRAFRTSSLQEFRSTYRSLDCLIIDDVQFLKKKTTTQEELFHTFNRLHTQGMQIILSGNTLPTQLDGIEERLKSRFEWGIILSLSPTTLVARKKILQRRAEALALPLTELTETYLLQTFQSLPTLIRALEALVLRSHQSQANLNISTMHYLLEDLIHEERSSQLTPEKIVKIVAETCRIHTEDILGRSQNKECVLPRKISMYFCRVILQMPYTKIGEFFTRDHSTVISSVKQMKESQTNQKKEITNLLFEIKSKLS